MDIHPPTGKVHSIKEYLIHLSMVVFGILIALGLEGWRESRHEHELVKHSIEALRLEVKANMEELQRVMSVAETTRETMKNAGEVIDTAIQRRLNKQPVSSELKSFQINFDTPTLTSGAWQAAVATQALAHMDYSQARTWASLYADQEDLRPLQNELISAFARMISMGSVTESDDLSRLQNYRDLGFELHSRIALMQQNWNGLLKRYEQTLNETNADE